MLMRRKYIVALCYCILARSGKTNFIIEAIVLRCMLTERWIE